MTAVVGIGTTAFARASASGYPPETIRALADAAFRFPRELPDRAERPPLAEPSARAAQDPGLIDLLRAAPFAQ